MVEGKRRLLTTSQPTLPDQFLLYGASIMEQSSTQERGFALAPALQQGRCILTLDLLDSSQAVYHMLRTIP